MLLKIEGYSWTGQNVFYSVLSSSVESWTLTYPSKYPLSCIVNRAIFTWLSKGIGFCFGFGFTTPFGWLVYLLWFWFYDSQVKTALNHICKNKMHLSLCDQMVEFVNLCPLGQDGKNEALKTKRSMAFWNCHLKSVIKRRSCLLFLVKHFIKTRQNKTMLYLESHTVLCKVKK